MRFVSVFVDLAHHPVEGLAAVVLRLGGLLVRHLYELCELLLVTVWRCHPDLLSEPIPIGCEPLLQLRLLVAIDVVLGRQNNDVLLTNWFLDI